MAGYKPIFPDLSWSNATETEFVPDEVDSAPTYVAPSVVEQVTTPNSNGDAEERQDAGSRVIKYIVIHCAATLPKTSIRASTIRGWHLQRGWSDIGYHKVICADGVIENGRPMERVGSHVKGYNKNSIGVCMVGGVNAYNKPTNNFTEAQWDSLGRLIDDLAAQYPDAEILGHRDFPGVAKACPSFNVKKWLRSR